MSGREMFGPVRVSREIHDAFHEVRRSGEVNMFDRAGVIRVATRLDCAPEFSLWVHDNQADYARAIRFGIEVNQEPA